MRNVLMGTAALALIVGMPALAQDHGKGKGPPQAHGHGDKGKPGPGRGHGRDKAPGRHDARHDPDAQQARHQPPGHQSDIRRGVDAREHRLDAREDRHDRDLADVVRQRDYARVSTVVERRDRPDIRRVAYRITEPARVVHIDRPRTTFVDGCPPGLAKKHNGCLPPGQAKKLLDQRAYYESWWPQDRGDSYRYGYADGYLLRLQPQTLDVLSYVPVLGGALSPGNLWPTNYAAAPVPDYYVDYFGYDDPYDYRYANNAIFGVDPQTNMIQQIATLLTGDTWSIGQQMPTGYDVYNVPYDYRDQYADTADSLYRYSDGYVYQVDPTTRLIQAAIQLIV